MAAVWNGTVSFPCYVLNDYSAVAGRGRVVHFCWIHSASSLSTGSTEREARLFNHSTHVAHCP